MLSPLIFAAALAGAVALTSQQFEPTPVPTPVGFDNCKSCPGADVNPYQKECQNPKIVKECYPRMSDDVCPPGTLPCTDFPCPPDSYIGHAPPRNMSDCVCDYGYHAVGNKCAANATAY